MNWRELCLMIGGLVFVAAPVGLAAAVGIVAGIEWAVQDTLRYGFATFVLGLGTGLLIAHRPIRETPSEDTQQP